jgi:hypothetical protein
VPAEAGRQADDPLAVLAQQLPVDPRVVVEPVEVAEADQELQVAKPTSFRAKSTM